MVLALSILAFGVVAIVAVSGVLFWCVAKTPSPFTEWLVWSVCLAGLWALGLGLFLPNDVKWIALLAPIAGPMIATWIYLDQQVDTAIWRMGHRNTGRSTPRSIADGD